MKNKNIILKLLIGWGILLTSTSIYAQPGAVDPSFNIGTGFTNKGNVAQTYSALQTDGKIIVVGEFDDFNGNACHNIIRLNPDGTADATYNPGSGFDGIASAIVLQADGKAIVSGSFTSFNNTPRNCIVRINTNGSIDATFDPGSGFAHAKGTAYVPALALQADGKILAGGSFVSYNNTAAENIIRINPNGTGDASFKASVDKNINTFALQTDGKIVMGGVFTSVNGTSQTRISRLNVNGDVDITFNTGTGFDRDVYKLLIQPDGKILAGGHFGKYNGVQKVGLARLQANGSLETAFNNGLGYEGLVMSLALQPDGKIIAGGNYGYYNDTAVQCISRLESNGNLDTSFKPGTGFVFGANNKGQVWDLAIQPDGKVITSGIFTGYDGGTFNSIARLNAFVPALQITSLSPDNNYCRETQVNIGYSIGIGKFNAGNVFTAQLSDANGSFSSPVNIGSVSSTTDGIIHAVIPANTSAGNNYRVRVVSSNPVLTGLDNGTDLVVKNGSIPTITIAVSADTICEGENVILSASGNAASYSWDNNVKNGITFPLTKTTTFTVTATAENGCSNSEQVTVKVNSLPQVVANGSADTICHGGQVTLFGSGANSYTWDKNVSDNVAFKPLGTETYTVTGRDLNNCENEDRIIITVRDENRVTHDTTICVQDTYVLGSQRLNKSGTYTEIFQNADRNGCDSVVTLNLLVVPQDVSVTQNGRTLTANAENASYQWINCDDNTVLTGINSQSFTSNIDGNFAVIITQLGCSDTSACFSVSDVGIQDRANIETAALYPNPVTDILNIKAKGLSSIQIKDVTGRGVYSASFTPAKAYNHHMVNMRQWQAGVYILHIAADGRQLAYKVVKQ